MAYTLAFGGDPNISRSSGYSGNYLWSPYGGFPAGRISSGAVSHPVMLFGTGVDSGSGYDYVDIFHDGVSTSTPGYVWNDADGGSFDVRVGHFGGGTITVGCNTGNGSTLHDSADGIVLGGGICGWFNWGIVALPPAMVSATRLANGQVRVIFNGSGDTGGVSMVNAPGQSTPWQLQYATNPSFSGATTVQSTGTSDLTLTPGFTYYFRSRGYNQVGWSNWSSAISLFVQAGGKRYNGSSFVNTTIARRFDGANFINLVTAKRFDGANWTNLS